jgi:hypothetical protein
MYNKIESFEITSSSDFPKHKNENEEGVGWDYSCIRTFWPECDYFKAKFDFTFVFNAGMKNIGYKLVYCEELT